MKALLLSAYAARSHRHWQTAVLSMLPDWDWCELNLPPRYFSWRIRGNAMTWSVNERAVLDSPRELLLATSMVDLATLRARVSGQRFSTRGPRRKPGATRSRG